MFACPNCGGAGVLHSYQVRRPWTMQGRIQEVLPKLRCIDCGKISVDYTDSCADRGQHHSRKMVTWIIIQRDSGMKWSAIANELGRMVGRRFAESTLHEIYERETSK